jgi:hypothetical protein
METNKYFILYDKVIINAGFNKGKIATITDCSLITSFSGKMEVAYCCPVNGETVYYFENELLPYNEVTKVLYGK